MKLDYIAVHRLSGSPAVWTLLSAPSCYQLHHSAGLFNLFEIHALDPILA